MNVAGVPMPDKPEMSDHHWEQIIGLLPEADPADPAVEQIIAPPVRDREAEVRRIAAEREARRALAVHRRAERVFARMGKWQLRELQDLNVLHEFLTLLNNYK